MTDIANIGFRADTSDLATAATVLNRLPAAVNAAEKSADALGQTLGAVANAANGVVTSSGNVSRVIAATNSNLNKSVTTIDKVTASYKKLSDMQSRINNATGVKTNDNFDTASMIQYGRELDGIRAKFSPLFAAQRTYKQELIDINSALKIGAINEREHAAAIMDTKVAFVQQVNTIRGVNDNLTSFNTNAKAAGKAASGLSYDAKNLSFQLVDVGQGILGGQPLFQIFAQQAGQIGQIIGTSPQGLGGLMKELGKSIASVLTPTRLIAIGIIALGAAVLVAYSSWKTFTLQLDDAAKVANTTTASLSKLQAAASFEGIDAGDFNSSIQNFAKNVYDAKNNMGGLADVLQLNNMRASTFDATFENVAEIIKRVGPDYSKAFSILQQVGLPATMQWVRLLQGGREGIEKAKQAAAGFAANDDLVKSAREFDKAWNTAWTNFGLNARSAFQRALEFGQTFFDKMDNLAKKVGNSDFWKNFYSEDSAKAAGVTLTKQFDQRFSGDSSNSVSSSGALANALNSKVAAMNGQKAVDPNAAKQANALAQQSISILGDLATVNDLVRQKQLELDAATMNHVYISDTARKALLNLTEAQARNNLVQQQATIGVFNLDQANKAAALTLQSWIDKKLLDPTSATQMAAAHAVLAKNIRDTADAAAVAASALPQLKQLELDSNNVAKVIDSAAVGAVNNLSSALGDVFNGTVKLGQGFKNMGVIILQALQQAIIKLLIIGPLMKGLSGGLGGIGSFFGFSQGGATSGGGTGFSTTTTGGLYAKGGVYANDNVQKFADGGAFTNKVVNKTTFFANGGKLAAMGEAGPEAIMPLKRGPNGSLGVQMHGGGSGGGSGQIVYAPTYQLGGKVSQEDLEALKRAQDKDRQEFTSKVANANGELSRRNYKGRNGR